MSRSVLLIEDNHDDAFFFTAAARKARWTHNIVVAANGREAIDILTRYIGGEFTEPLSLALLDLKMPFVGGLEVLEWVQRQPALHFLPVVVLTSSEQEADIEAAYRLGAASFLVKPSVPEELGDLVRAIDAYWLRHNRVPAATLDRETASASRRTS
jgi:CheY-like chemotaxis protein